jgi:acetate kinase
MSWPRASHCSRCPMATSGVLDIRFGLLQRHVEWLSQAGCGVRVRSTRLVSLVQRSVAAMSAAMEGIDGLVFTGGAGEASSRLRADACAGLDFLGVELVDSKNQALSGDGLVSALGASPAVLVVEAREDLEIAYHVWEWLE